MKKRVLWAFALASLILFAVAVFTPANQPLEELPGALTRPVSYVAGGAFLATIAFWKRTRRAFWRWEFPVVLLTAVVSAGVVTWILLLFFNVLLDSSPPRAREMQIVAKRIRPARRGGPPSYELQVRDARDRQSREVDVERALFERKAVGERVKVTTRAGGLGVERVERVE